jgi:hypothetical protein
MTPIAPGSWICGVLGKFADAQKADFVELITAIIKYAPPGYAPPDRKKLDGPHSTCITRGPRRR